MANRHWVNSGCGALTGVPGAKQNIGPEPAANQLGGNSMSQWYYQLLGEVVGPFSWEQLQEKAVAGDIEPGTLVRQGTEGQWQEASTVAGLFGSQPAAPSPAESSPATATPEVHPEQQEGPSAGGMVRRSPLALRPCADCGHMVSRQANCCPNCGRMFHEASSVIRYRGEHPIPVLVFFGMLAVVFLVVTPVLVNLAAYAVLSRSLTNDELAAEIAVGIAAGYVISMVVCALLGGAVGKPKMAYLTGLFLGLFFGPLGVFTAYAIDKRPQCYHCFSRLNGMAHECPFCHARLLWKVESRWF